MCAICSIVKQMVHTDDMVAVRANDLVSEQASERASEQARKPTSERASERANKQAGLVDQCHRMGNTITTTARELFS